MKGRSGGSPHEMSPAEAEISDTYKAGFAAALKRHGTSDAIPYAERSALSDAYMRSHRTLITNRKSTTTEPEEVPT